MMQDLKLNNSKKALVNFKDLKEGRESIIKSSSKSKISTDFYANQLARNLHLKSMAVKVERVVEETKDTKSFYLERCDGEIFPVFQAGSYVTLRIKIDDNTYVRAYSISSSPFDRKKYRITVKKDGDGIVSNYMLEYMKEGDTFIISGPYGTFHYNGIRDSKDIIMICGGGGITPIMSILHEVLFKKKVESVTLLYGTRTSDDIIFKEELEELQKKYKNFKIKYILSEEEKEGFSYGYITKEMILEENPEHKSFFLCGPTLMYDSLNEIFKELDIPNKYIRHEIYKSQPDDLEHMEYQLTILIRGQEITVPCFSDETLVRSMERSHINAPVHCTVGECGFCRSKLVSGEVKTDISSFRKKDIEQKYVHPCVTYPLSDVTIELPF